MTWFALAAQAVFILACAVLSFVKWREMKDAHAQVLTLETMQAAMNEVARVVPAGAMRYRANREQYYRDLVQLTPAPELARCAENQAEERKKAHERSMELLNEHLSEAQRKEFAETGNFTVIGSDGGHYRIRSRVPAYNVQELTRNGAYARDLCFTPDQSLPEGDRLLTQKIYLESDERATRRVANFSDKLVEIQGQHFDMLIIDDIIDDDAEITIRVGVDEARP